METKLEALNTIAVKHGHANWAIAKYRLDPLKMQIIIEEAMEYYTEQSNSHKHGVGGPVSDVRSEGEQLGNEALGKAGEVEVLNIKTGQLLSVDGYVFMFGKDLNSGEIRCFNIENLSGESREGALR